ncbi:MAG: redox-regulated ATPase YchF [Patescibacteria group bacterium]
MALSIGIVGLPNVGKSTLFNSLLKRQQALCANYPFATIEPNVGVVAVPDARLDKLFEITSTPGVGAHTPGVCIKTPAVCKFVDIAGLAPNAHKGEGLGNKFLSHIREVEVILHLVRAFKDENIIRAGSVDPEKDIELINTELILKDIETVQKMLGTRSKRVETVAETNALKEILEHLNSGILLYNVKLTEGALELCQNISLLTLKPQVVVFNTDENIPTPGVCISAKLENELSSLSEEDQKEYLKQLGIEKSGLDKVIAKCYELLGYKNFFTAGPKEVRAWQFIGGMTAQECAGVIHTDFEKNFIAADVVDWKDFVEEKGWKNCKDKGLVRLEGRGYLMRDGDVVVFRLGSF